MELYDKRMGREKRESLELAEAARQREWDYPSFVRDIFHGRLKMNLIFPFPQQPQDDAKIGDEYVKNIKEFLVNNLDPDEVDRTGEIPKKVVDGLVDMGCFALKIPKEYGGLGLSQTNYNRIMHMIASFCGSTAVLLSAHQSIGVPYPLSLFGTEEQKRKYLPMFRKGAISGFALTEPGAGSDPRTIKTTATPVEGGKYYLLNGEKLWCTNGNIADILIVMAVTPPKVEKQKEKKQITAFIVETKTPGFEVVHRCSFMGLHGLRLGLLRFNNVKVPAENILLGEGAGLKLAFITLNTGRLTVPAAMTGASKWCLSVARRWAKERRQWGSPIGEHEAIATKLSQIAATTFAMDAVTWLASSMADAKKLDIRLEAAMAKMFCAEMAWRIADETFQIRGGRGFETSPSLKARGEQGFAVERVFRDVRVNLIIEGTSQIMRLFIAREALDLHLKRIQSVFGLFYYIIWFPKLWLPSFASRSVTNLPRPLNQHMMFVQRTSKRLAREIFLKMVIYQKRLESKQNILGRFVDIGTDLFVMSAACSYAACLSEQNSSAIELADLYCQQARARIKRDFSDNYFNRDKLGLSVAKKILKDEYEWLEDGIIK